MVKKKSLDSLPVGIIISIVLPIIVFLAVYFGKYRSGVYTYLSFKDMLGNIVPKILSLCAIANLAPFYFFLQTNRMVAVRGVVVGTMVIGILVFFLFLLF